MKNPNMPEDGNDHVTAMKPLATLQKHKTDLAYRQSAERTQRKHSQLRQLQMCSVYPVSLFRWLAKHTTCTIFAVLLGSLLDVIVHAIWSHSLAAIVDSWSLTESHPTVLQDHRQRSLCLVGVFDHSLTKSNPICQPEWRSSSLARRKHVTIMLTDLILKIKSRCM